MVLRFSIALLPYCLPCDTTSHKNNKLFGELQKSTCVYKTIELYMTTLTITLEPQKKKISRRVDQSQVL